MEPEKFDIKILEKILEYINNIKTLFGADTAENETKQLDYYKNKGVSIANYSDVIKKYQEKYFLQYFNNVKS